MIAIRTLAEPPAQLYAFVPMVGRQLRRRALPALFATVLLSAVVGAMAPPALARIDLTRRYVVVQSSDAGAVIFRKPFRLWFLNSAGCSVLSEVPNTGPALKPEPITTDPLNPGFDNPANPPLYAPLSFTVGRQDLTQYEGGVWGGNPLTGTRSGIRYSARNVVDVTRVGSGVRLVVGTDDPSGRRLIVLVRPLGTRAVRVTAALDRAGGVASLSDSFSSGRDEGFFGFGGRHNAIDQHGSLLTSFVEEENVNGLTGFGKGGNGRSLYPNGPSAAYYPQAEFFSSRRYGFLLNSPELARFRMDSDHANAWNVEVSAPSIDYVFAPGSPAKAIRTLTQLSGRQPVAPRWALGPMLDRLVKYSAESPEDYQANVAADLVNLQRYRTPVTAYRIEGWGFPGGNDGLALHTFTSPSEQAQVIATLRQRHIHAVVYLRPWIQPGSAPVAEGLVVRHADGSPYYTTGSASQKIALLDFTNAAAVRFWQQEVAKAFDLGADGFMQDFGEQVLYDMHYHDGETGVTMHNRYLVLYAKATREEIVRYERSHPGRHLWFFDRAGYSGLPGSAAYDGGTFPGDETTDWTPSSGIASLTPDMLSRAVTGAYGFATDIGGYYDLATPPTTKELFLRWAEWAALSPIFRLHGSSLAGTHTPWSYDAQTVRVYNRLSRLHLRAVPLILSLWREADRSGMPITRPLWLAYPHDRAAWRQEQEWLLGQDVLVAPVVTEGATSRSVYFPAGCWRSPSGHRTYRGPRSATVSAPLTDLPFFVRCDTAPLGTKPLP
jgi:alpha-glucosidase (family GH31 glycosyl hydrolase)